MIIISALKLLACDSHLTPGQSSCRTTHARRFARCSWFMATISPKVRTSTQYALCGSPDWPAMRDCASLCCYNGKAILQTLRRLGGTRGPPCQICRCSSLFCMDQHARQGVSGIARFERDSGPGKIFQASIILPVLRIIRDSITVICSY